MTNAIVITQGGRRAVIDGEEVSLYLLPNKKRPAKVWPTETVVGKETDRLLIGLLWVTRAFIELPGTKA